jgi:hypothetical protein
VRIAGAQVTAGAERLHQLRILGNVCEAVECRRPPFVVSVRDEMRRSGLFIGAEGSHEVYIAGDVIQAVEARGAALVMTVFDVMVGAHIIRWQFRWQFSSTRPPAPPAWAQAK